MIGWCSVLNIDRENGPDFPALGYEIFEKGNFSELAGVVAWLKEWNRGEKPARVLKLGWFWFGSSAAWYSGNDTARSLQPECEPCLYSTVGVHERLTGVTEIKCDRLSIPLL